MELHGGGVELRYLKEVWEQGMHEKISMSNTTTGSLEAI